LEKYLSLEFLKIDKKNASIIILMKIGGRETVGDRKHVQGQNRRRIIDLSVKKT
jgi:hypothetical protein